MAVVKDSDIIGASKTISRAQHNISRADISKSALKVLYRLKQAGYEGFLVGGGVRDLLLGREPKDFDVVTDAKPEEVKQLFRNCRLVGRRFRLAHVRFGREVVEVATFRAAPSADREGRILRDNRYGSLEQDAWRRDFSINCLYYSIRDFSVADFTGGMDDLKTGTLRLVGDPEVRYREDPVRVLRAVRFAAKLGFRIHPASEAPISRLGVYLNDVPAARLYEEVLKLFHSGYAVQCYELLRHYGIFGHLFPETEVCLRQEDAVFPRTFVATGLSNTDTRIAENKPVTPAFLFAVILWGPMVQRVRRYQRQGRTESEAYQQAGAETLMRQSGRVALPRRFATVTQEIWTMQRQLFQRRGKQPLKLIHSPRFRAAYDFLVLRAETGEDVTEPAEWWTHFQEADEAGRRLALAHLARVRRPRRSQSVHRKRR